MKTFIVISLGLIAATMMFITFIFLSASVSLAFDLSTSKSIVVTFIWIGLIAIFFSTAVYLANYITEKNN